ELGSRLHELIERYLDAWEEEEEKGEKGEEEELERVLAGCAGPEERETHRACALQFVLWWRDFRGRGWRPYRVEWRVFCLLPGKRVLAGTVDAVFRNKESGKFALVDWKRTPGPLNA